MKSKRTPSKMPDPLFGNAPDMPPEALSRDELASELHRVLRKNDTRSNEATDKLLSEFERHQAEVWAASARSTLYALSGPIEDALRQPSRAGAANADRDLRARVVAHAKRMLDAGYKRSSLCSSIRRAISNAWTTKHIREVLKEERLWPEPSRK